MRRGVLALLLLSGCAAPSAYLNEFARSPEVLRWCSDYKGHPSDGIRKAIGDPVKTAELADGFTILYFDRTGWTSYLAVEVDPGGIVRRCSRSDWKDAAQAWSSGQRPPMRLRRP